MENGLIPQILGSDLHMEEPESIEEEPNEDYQEDYEEWERTEEWE